MLDMWTHCCIHVSLGNIPGAIMGICIGYSVPDKVGSLKVAVHHDYIYEGAN